MKLVLLPGMDGTGLLFEPLIPLLPVPYTIISYPSTPEQTYESIYRHIKANLPREDFYIVAESFSGPIAARLASENLANLKGIIFVATFLSCPSKRLVKLAKKLPLKAVLNLSFLQYLIGKYALGDQFSLALFLRAMSNVSEQELKQRMTALQSLDKNQIRMLSTINALYIGANKDWLVEKKHVEQFYKFFPNISVVYIDGTHFLLQFNPAQCAQHILQFVDT